MQGVWFRKSTLEQAFSSGVKGFVRNEPDGSVYIEAEGNSEQLQQFIDWCRKGPELARVDKLEATEGAVVDFIEFEIL